jgi:hypothetical protein
LIVVLVTPVQEIFVAAGREKAGTTTAKREKARTTTSFFVYCARIEANY